MTYRVTLAPTVDRAVARLPKKMRSRVADRLDTLSQDPRPPGSIKLTGEDAYPIRVGDYRIIYTIHDDRLVVIVIDVGHRGDVYRRR